MRVSPLATAVLAVAFASPQAATAAPEVVTSIKPLQLIAAAITEGVSQPQVLIDGGMSPHDYALKPSDRRTLDQAGLVLWVGEELEPFMHKPLSAKAAQQVLTLSEVLQLAAGEHAEHDEHQEAHHDEHAKHEEAHQGHDHDKHEEHGDHAKHEEAHQDHEHDKHEEHGDHAKHDEDEHHHSYDPHVWMSPAYGKQIAVALSERLGQLDEANRAQYQANLERFVSQLEQTDQQIRNQLTSVQQQGYYVFHDAYGYFEQHYGLKHLGAFTLNPEQKPGAKKLGKIRASLEQQQAKCVFAEPQFKPAVVEAVVQGTQVRQGVLDPLAMEIAVNAQGYSQYLQQLAGAFHRCLAE